MVFTEAIGLYFQNYVNFTGRSRRSEYWWVCLFNMIVSGILTAALPEIAGIWTLAVAIPSLSLAVRRLHDIGKSGACVLFALIPLVGWIIVLVFLCTASGPDNQYGRRKV